MNKEETIKQAIKKAKENGYKKYHGYFAKDWDDAEIRAMVFDIKFAKAFFGEKLRKKVWDEESGDYYIQEEWKYRLQQMVLCKDPLDYIKIFLEQ